MQSQFDKAGVVYEASELDLPMRKYLEASSIRAFCGEVSGRRALDLGCGTGLYTRALASWGAKEVFGVDISEGMLHIARERERVERLGITYLRRDLTRPCDWGPQHADLRGRLDLTLAVYVLCYATTVADLEAMCRTAGRDLEPAGRFIAPTMNPECVDVLADPDYYSAYGFRLTAVEAPPTDGSTVTLSIGFSEDPDVAPVSVNAVYRSAETYERALKNACFNTIIWHAMEPSEEGIQRHGARYWKKYTDRPHAMIIEAGRS